MPHPIGRFFCLVTRRHRLAFSRGGPYFSPQHSENYRSAVNRERSREGRTPSVILVIPKRQLQPRIAATTFCHNRGGTALVIQMLIYSAFGMSLRTCADLDGSTSGLLSGTALRRLTPAPRENQRAERVRRLVPATHRGMSFIAFVGPQLVVEGAQAQAQHLRGAPLIIVGMLQCEA